MERCFLSFSSFFILELIGINEQLSKYSKVNRVPGKQNFTDSNFNPLNWLSVLDIKNGMVGFPGGAVVKNPSASAGDTGSSPGPGRSHMPWSN